MPDNNQVFPADTEPTDEILKKFYKFKKDLEDTEIKDLKSESENCEGDVSQKEIIFDEKKNHWKKALEFFDEYLQIREEIAIKLMQSKEELITVEAENGSNGSSGESDEEPKGNINNAIKEYIELTTHFDDTVSCIKALQQKILGVVTAVQTLETAIKDPCNKQDFNQIKTGVSDFETQVEYLRTCANESCKEAKDNFEDAVKSAGIKALLNLSSIEELGKEIAKQVDAFVADINANLETASGHVSTKRDALDEAIRALCQSRDDCSVAKNLLEGYEYLVDFADPDNTRSEPLSMEKLLKKAEKNFDFQFKLEKAD